MHGQEIVSEKNAHIFIFSRVSQSGPKKFAFSGHEMNISGSILWPPILYNDTWIGVPGIQQQLAI